MEHALTIAEQPSIEVAQAVNDRSPNPEKGEIPRHFDREREGAGWREGRFRLPESIWAFIAESKA